MIPEGLVKLPKYEMIRELRQSTNKDIVKGMNKWKTEDVRDIWCFMKQTQVKQIMKKIMKRRLKQ